MSQSRNRFNYAMSKTKIVCTLGPACNTQEIIKKMAAEGMDVARINFSHGTYEEHGRLIDNIKAVRKEASIPLAILLDTKGPELRIKSFKDGKVTLSEGDRFVLTSREVEGDAQQVSVNHREIIEDAKVGGSIFLNNALMEMVIVDKTETDLVCRVVKGGVLSSRKSMNIPGIVFSFPYLSEADKQDLLFGIAKDVDYVAASFVCSAQDVKTIRAFLDGNGGKNINIISKIESRRGVDNADEIIAVSDGIMVARGDLGVEVPIEEIPYIQKSLIKNARLAGLRVITATEMLESMTTNPRPTRAETSDVGNAVYDETSAVMTSGETAVGKYPVETVKTMAKICLATENHINYNKRFKELSLDGRNIADAVSHATCNAAVDLNAAAVVVFTRSGVTAKLVSRFRPETQIIGVTDDIKVYHQLALSWGVCPVLTGIYSSTDELFNKAVEICRDYGFAESGEIIVVSAGVPVGESGQTNMLKIQVMP